MRATDHDLKTEVIDTLISQSHKAGCNFYLVFLVLHECPTTKHSLYSDVAHSNIIVI